MFTETICIFFITHCFAKELVQHPRHTILHDNVQPSTEPFNISEDYFDSMNLPNPDYKFNYLYEQKRTDEDPQVEEREEEIGKYMHYQRLATTPTTAESQQPIIDFNEKEKEQQLSNGELKTSMKVLDSHPHLYENEEPTSTLAPIPPVPKLYGHSNKGTHLPTDYWDNIYRRQSTAGTLKWNKSPNSDSSYLTGLHLPTHEWKPNHLRHPSHRQAHILPTTSEIPFKESPVLTGLHLPAHGTKPNHINHHSHHEVHVSSTTPEIPVEVSSAESGLHISTHESKPHLRHLSHHHVHILPTMSEMPVEVSSDLHRLNSKAPDTKPNHITHPTHHELYVSSTTPEIPVEVSSAETGLHLSALESKPNHLRQPTHHHVHKSPTISKMPVDGSSNLTGLDLSSHESKPNYLRRLSNHEVHTSPTTSKIPVEVSSASTGLQLSTHASKPLKHPGHHQAHILPTTSEIPVKVPSTSHTLHTNHVSTQHIPRSHSRNGYIASTEVNKIVNKKKYGQSAGHAPRSVYRGSYKFSRDDVNDMHTSPIRRVKPAKVSHPMKSSTPPPVPTLSPWYDGYGK